MKWPLNRGFNNQKVPQRNYVSGFHRSFSHSTSHAAKIIFCFICTGMFLSGDGDRLKTTEASASSHSLAARVDRTAAKIGVRILDRNFLGSGFIIHKTSNEYIVVTNQHVLRAGEAPYTVETFDGSTYRAEVATDMNAVSDRYDLAVLKFQADTEYQKAKIGSSLNLEVGDPVFAAGFPYQEFSSNESSVVDKESRVGNLRQLAFQPGRITVILDRALEEGYQIGYTNNVKKGMSGGPLLNEKGEVVGVNGKHAYPLWESPEIYQDGTEPCSALQELITRSSLAIPIEKSIRTNTLLQEVAPSAKTDYSAKSDSNAAKSSLVARMQLTAESTLMQCREESAYGSGK